MKVTSLIEAYKNENITPEIEQSFKNFFKRIKRNVKSSADVDITPKWVAGFLNQQADYSTLNKKYDDLVSQGKDAEAKDTLARIAARNTLQSVGLVNRGRIVDPKTASLMRQYYTQQIHDENEVTDAGKLTRGAAESEYQDWFKSLPEKQQSYVKNLQEITPEEFSNFKGLVTAKENKREFMHRLYTWTQTNDVSLKLLQNMGLVNNSGKIDLGNIEDFREFLEGLSIPRIKDILSKSSVYAGKSITHAEHRNKNAVLKDIENNPSSIYSKIIDTYNKISPNISRAKDKRRALSRALQEIPNAVVNGKLSNLGKGVVRLFKQFKGGRIDTEQAIASLNAAYNSPASRDRRNAKAETRGQTIKDIADL